MSFASLFIVLPFLELLELGVVAIFEDHLKWGQS